MKSPFLSLSRGAASAAASTVSNQRSTVRKAFPGRAFENRTRKSRACHSYGYVSQCVHHPREGSRPTVAWWPVTRPGLASTYLPPYIPPSYTPNILFETSATSEREHLSLSHVQHEPAREMPTRWRPRDQLPQNVSIHSART